MKRKYLIISSDQDTWAKGSDTVFLGEWCKLYSEKDSWKNKESCTIEYHWRDREKFFKDSSFINELYEYFLDELTLMLNQCHHINKSKEYWRFVIGVWLQDFIFIIFDKYCSLKKAFDEEEITDVILKPYEHDTFVPNNLEDFILKSSNATWNEYIANKLLLNIKPSGLNITFLKDKTVSFKEGDEAKSNSLRKKSPKSLNKKLKLMINSLFKAKNYFSYGTSMSHLNLFSLNLKLGELYIYTEQPVNPRPSQYSPNDRELDWPSKYEANNFKSLIQNMIMEFIPKSYIEDLRSYRALVNSLPWPKKPKIIFSSAAFLEEDIFNLWSAEKKEKGSMFISGQHGGNLGISKVNMNFSHQIKISDKLLMWGSQSESEKYLGVGNFKLHKKEIRHKKNGSLLFVQNTERMHAYKCNSSPISSLWLDYHQNQKDYVKRLAKEVRDDLIVRLYMHDENWDQTNRWQDEFEGLILDDGSSKIENLYNRSRLVIATNHGTTHVESIHFGIPTLMFWDEELWEINPLYTSLFRELKEVGIFHTDPISASNFTNEIWNNVEEWWLEKSVVHARNKFLKIHSCSDKNLLRKVADNFTENHK